MERLSKPYRYFLIVSTIAYIAIVLLIYYIGGRNSFVQTVYMRTNSYSMEMFNFVPLKNILFYFSRIGTNKLDNWFIVLNLLYAVLLWIPAGYIACSFFKKTSFWIKSLYFLIVVTVLFLARVFMLIGFFDVDKIIQAYLGFIIGFGICFGLSKLMQLAFGKTQNAIVAK